MHKKKIIVSAFVIISLILLLFQVIKPTTLSINNSIKIYNIKGDEQSIDSFISVKIYYLSTTHCNTCVLNTIDIIRNDSSEHYCIFFDFEKDRDMELILSKYHINKNQIFRSKNTLFNRLKVHTPLRFSFNKFHQTQNLEYYNQEKNKFDNIANKTNKKSIYLVIFTVCFLIIIWLTIIRKL